MNQLFTCSHESQHEHIIMHSSLVGFEITPQGYVLGAEAVDTYSLVWVERCTNPHINHYTTTQFDNISYLRIYLWHWLDFAFWCFNATFRNISAISWRPVLVVEEAGVSGEILHGQVTGKLYHLRLRVECTLFLFTKPGAIPHRIGDRLVWVVR